MHGQLLHAGLVAQDAALAALAARVDGQHGQLAAILFQDVQAEDIYAGALACAGHAADAYADGGAGVGQALLDDFLRHGLVFGPDALHQGDGLAEDGDIALDDAVHVFGHREFALLAPMLQVRIDGRGLLYACIDHQAFVGVVVFGMLHGIMKN